MTSVLRFFDAVNDAVGIPLFLDWVVLFAQAAGLLLLVVREVVQKKDRNLYAVLLPITLLLLVQGQDWWTLAQLQTAPYIVHLTKLISRDGARLANLYVGMAMGLFVVGYRFASRVRRSVGRPRILRNSHGAPSGRVAIFSASLIAVAGATGLFILAGGVTAAIANPGRIVAGQTLFLILAGMGKMPAFGYWSTGRRPSIYAFALLAMTFVVTLLNSRFLALFIAVQAAIVAHYCWRPIRRKTLVAGAGLAVAVLLVFGLYRDFAGLNSAGLETTAIGAQGFLAVRAPTGPVDWFYRLNVEGFTGFAGILTYEAGLPGGLSHDYGVSSLSFVTQILPNGIRTDPALPFKGASDFFASVYPYKGSVVSPGFELAYGGFGLAGVLALGALLGYATKAFDIVMRTRASAGTTLLVGLLSVQLLQVVRGTFATTILFGLGDATLTGTYLLLSRSYVKSSTLPRISGDAILGTPAQS